MYRMLRLCSSFVLIFWLTAGALAAQSFSGAIRVIDGDTFDVGTVRVRLYGIDAPEQDQECRRADGASWACGAWVTTQVARRFAGRHATCLARDIDRYGRTVASCTVEGVDVGRQLVGKGLAFAYRRYAMDYDLDEKAALVAGVGLHGSQVQAPAAYRRTRGAGGEAPDAACAIKGNISKSGQIYHMPGQRDYDRTGIDTARGERWFCSETQAQAAGWRRARR